MSDPHKVKSSERCRAKELKDSIKVLDEVIPPPGSPMVDWSHLEIAQAWAEVKEWVNSPEVSSAVEKSTDREVVTARPLKEDVVIGVGTFKAGTTVLSTCPACGGWLRPMQKYCADCGQAIYWPESEVESNAEEAIYES